MSGLVSLPVPATSAPLAALCARRVRYGSVYLVAVVQAWSWHLTGLARARLRRHGPEAGMTTAEYAVGTVAACGFAALLYKLLTGGAVSALLTGIIKKALSAV